jgi:hypothetical protein
MSYFAFAAVLASAEVAKSLPKPLSAGPAAASAPLSPSHDPQRQVSRRLLLLFLTNLQRLNHLVFVP